MLSATVGGSQPSRVRPEDDPEHIAVRKSILEQHRIFERREDPLAGFALMVATGKLPPTGNELTTHQSIQLLALASLYAAYLDFYQVAKMTGCNISRTTKFLLLGEDECAARIIRISWFVREVRGLSPQSVWPSLLLTAGIASNDGIHRSWVLSTLKETEPWATHYVKTRALLEAAYTCQRQSQPSQPVDLVSIQAQSTGPFII